MGRRRTMAAGTRFAAALFLSAPGAGHAATPERPPPPKAAACERPVAACVQWLSLGHGAGRSMVYATYSLDQGNPAVRRALVMVHGTLRNADHYFATATTAAFLADALGDTLVIAPALHSSDAPCDDYLQPREISWSCGKNSWRSGGEAVGDAELTSFDFMDALLERLADKRLFPNLKLIVVAGHSAGGQFVARYEMSNRVHERLGVPVTYVVANPSSYAWPDGSRMLPEGDGTPAAGAAAWKDEAPHAHFSFGPFAAAASVPDYDLWPYGLEARAGYAARLTLDDLRRQLATRPTTYLLSQVDVLPLGGFDSSPEAMAQGATRRQRGEAFTTYIRARLGADPHVIIIPECGHNDRCVFTSDAALPVIFPEVADIQAGAGAPK